MRTVDQAALGLYVVGSRDPSDFLDMIRDDDDTDLETLVVLRQMLADPGGPQTDRELNAMLLPIVDRELERRGPAVLDRMRFLDAAVSSGRPRLCAVRKSCPADLEHQAVHEHDSSACVEDGDVMVRLREAVREWNAQMASGDNTDGHIMADHLCRLIQLLPGFAS